MDNEKKLEALKAKGKAPEWLSSEGYSTLLGGYLCDGESPFDLYSRLADTSASYYGSNKAYRDKLFTYLWNGWLSPSTPVASNFGTDRAFPISCFSIHSNDSTFGIFSKVQELAMLSKYGGGVGVYLGDVRGKGAPISKGGISDGIIPWAKVFDSTTIAVNQAGVRRGNSVIYLPIDHPDIEEFLDLRRPTGDMNRRCMNIHHAVCISNAWMDSMLAGDKKKRELYTKLITLRFEMGEPYILFTDNVNNQNPECYKTNGLNVKTSNLCCLSGDTLVLTKELGYAPIESLVGKDVTIFDGSNWVENDGFELKGVADKIYRVHVSDGSYIDCTDNHRWFAANSYTDIRYNKYREVQTKDLKEGVWLEAHNTQSHGDVVESGAYLKGFLLGDGTYSHDRPLLWLYHTKYGCQSVLIESANEMPVESSNTNCITEVSFSEEQDFTGKYPYAFGTQRRKTMRGLSSRKSLYQWCTSYKISLPDYIYKLDRDSKLKLLAGLFDADGSGGRCLQLSSKHLSFIQQVQYLIKSFGYSANIDTSTMKDGRLYHRLTVSSHDAYLFMQELPLQRLKWVGSNVPNRKTTQWRKVVKIELLDSTTNVFCTTVPTTGKFALANGIMSGNSEIMLYTDPDHSFVCCLSSLNLAKWEDWKDTDIVETSIRFLDSVITEFITKASGKHGFEASVRSAIKGRALGLGVLGWHSLLQEKMIPFDSFQAMQLNNRVFKTIRERADKETSLLAKEFGEPEWCVGFGRRNTHTLAVAPTFSSSIICQSVSAGIEAWAANVFAHKTAKGTFVRKNEQLRAILGSLGQDTPEVWDSIVAAKGSVQHLDFLTKEQKEVFLTAREINQFAVIKQAAQRQQYIDQGQSLNLFFASNADPKYINQVHLEAYKLGIKALYYCRTEGVLAGDLATRSSDECKACEG